MQVVHRGANDVRTRSGRLPGRAMFTDRHRALHENVPGRMECNVVDALTVAVVRA
jgi:hypothetical protein